MTQLHRHTEWIMDTGSERTCLAGAASALLQEHPVQGTNTAHFVQHDASPGDFGSWPFLVGSYLPEKLAVIVFNTQTLGEMQTVALVPCN